MVNGRIGGRGGARQATRLDDCRTTLADGGDEGVAIPLLVIDDRRCWRTADGGEAVIGIHGRRMISPDDQFLDRVHRFAGLGGELRERAIVIQAQHGGEVFTREARCGFHRDVGVGIGGVSHDQHLHAARGHRVKRPALHGEDRAIGFEQVFSFHAWSARARTHE